MQKSTVLSANKSVGKQNPYSPTLRLTLTAMMAAIATVIYMIFPELVLIPGISYLKIDFSDFPALLLGLLIGPLEGMAVAVIKNLFHLLKTTTFGVGELMNVLIVSAMVLSLWGFAKVFAKCFAKQKQGLNATFHPLAFLPASACTVIISILVGWLLNLVLTPVYFWLAGIPVTTVAVMAGVWGSTLLNAVKAAINALLFYPLYYALGLVFQKTVSARKNG